jgi:outer membrane receptor protein involved in Fe transport
LTYLNESGRLYSVKVLSEIALGSHSCILVSLILSFLVAVSPAGAQEEETPAEAASEEREVLLPVPPEEDSKPSGGVDEMVVRASGREDFLKDLSISQTSFSAAEIKALRIQNIADLAEYTPNLEINTRSAASNPTLFIRGIGLKDYNANAAGAVSVYQDGININSPAIQLGQLFDIEEIAVLRGPQGSMNGRNATAGAIMINSVLPNGEFDVSGSFSYGNYNNLQAEGAIGFPIIEDLLSGRVAFTANFRDGTTKNNCSNWDPESIDKPVLSEESTRDAFAWNVQENPKYNKIKGKRFPKAGSDPSKVETFGDVDRRPVFVDEVCLHDSPGYLEFDSTTPPPSDWTTDDIRDLGQWTPSTDASATSLEDFQGLKKWVNNVDNWATRGIFRFQPDVLDGMDWVLNAHGGQNLGDSRRLQSLRVKTVLDGGNPSFNENAGDVSEAKIALNSNFKFEGIREIEGIFDSTGLIPNVGRGGDDIDAGFYERDGLELLDAWGVSLRGIWDTGPVVVTSLTGYEWYDRRIDDEGDAIPIQVLAATYEDSSQQWSQELRAAGEGELYRWFIGGFFLRDQLEASNLFPGLRSRRIEQTFSNTLMSGAVYGSGRYWVLDEVYVDAGLRYNIEQKVFTLASTLVTDSGTNTNIPEETKEETWTGLTGDVTIAWQPGGDWMYDARLDHLNLYAKYGRGMKGGHFNAGLTVQPDVADTQRIEPVAPEFIDAIELGFKSRWFQNRLIVNFAVFRYWYQDLQVFDFSNEVGELPIQKLLNSDASVLGAEIEIQARPFPGMLLQFSGGWLETEFIDFVVEKATRPSRDTGSLVEFDYSGNPLISAPTWNFSGVAEYQIPLGRWGSLVPQYSVSYRSKIYLDPQMRDPISQEPYFIHNARLAYRTPDGRFEIAGWVENFMNQRYKDDAFDVTLPPTENLILEVWNDPRMFGFTLSAYF